MRDWWRVEIENGVIERVIWSWCSDVEMKLFHGVSSFWLVQAGLLSIWAFSQSAIFVV